MCWVSISTTAGGENFGPLDCTICTIFTICTIAHIKKRKLSFQTNGRPNQNAMIFCIGSKTLGLASNYRCKPSKIQKGVLPELVAGFSSWFASLDAWLPPNSLRFQSICSQNYTTHLWPALAIGSWQCCNHHCIGWWYKKDRFYYQVNHFACNMFEISSWI